MIIYILSALIAIVLFISHLCGIDGYYFAYDWYDIPMHIIGGITLGLFAYQLSLSFAHMQDHSWKRIVTVILCIGIAWEIFETVYNIAGAPVGTVAYFVDTLKDLGNDIIGAFIGIGIASYISKKTRTQHVITS